MLHVCAARGHAGRYAPAGPDSAHFMRDVEWRDAAAGPGGALRGGGALVSGGLEQGQQTTADIAEVRVLPASVVAGVFFM